MRTRYLIATAFFAVLMLNSCVDDLFCTRGNGLSQTVVRRAAGFNSVENTNNLTVSLSGSGNIKSKNCITANSDVFLSGSGEIELDGQSENSILKISGSGKISSDNWVIGSADITITGSGDVFTFVETNLTAFISGSGNIYLKGNPTINKTITGSGRIINY